MTMTMSKQYIVALFCLIGYHVNMALWTVFGSKSMDPKVPLAVFLLMRLLAGIVFHGACTMWTTGGFHFKERLSNTPFAVQVFLSGSLIQYFSPIFYFAGGTMVSGSVLSIMDGPVIPIFVFIFALFFGMEKLPPSCKQKILLFSGLLGAVCGAVVLVFLSSGGGDDAEGVLLSPGMMLLLFESLSLSVGIVLQKKVCNAFTSFEFVFLMCISAAICCIAHVKVIEPGGLIYNMTLFFETLQTNAHMAYGFLFNVIAIGIINMLLLVYANSKLPSSIVSLAACCQPIIALMFEVAVFDVPLTLGHGLGIALVLGGVNLFNCNLQPPVTPELLPRKMSN